jgi:MFS family permease
MPQLLAARSRGPPSIAGAVWISGAEAGGTQEHPRRPPGGDGVVRHELLMAAIMQRKYCDHGLSVELFTTMWPIRCGRWRILPLLLIGVLGALAFASENARQSWSAIFAHDELHSGVGLSAVAPALFAGTVAITRFSIGGVKATRARTLLLAGALAAAAGGALIAAAPTLLIAGLGLAAAAAGTAVLFPTLLGVVSRNVDESRRGRVTSVVTTVSYLGFLAGPVYVGLSSDAVGLRGAMLAVAALAVGLFVLTPALLRLSGFGDPGRRSDVRNDEAARRTPLRRRFGICV